MPLKRTPLFVYQKIIIVFFVLMIPAYAIHIGINYMGFSFVKKQILSSHLANANFYAVQLESSIDFIRGRQLEFLNDSDLQKLGFMSDSLDKFQEIMLVKSIGEKLATIQNASPYVINSGVYIKSYGKTISTRGGVKNLPNDEWSSVKSRMESGMNKAVYYSKDTIIFVKSSNNDNFVSYLELSVSRFQQTLRQLVQGGSGAGVAIIDEPLRTPVIFDEADARIIGTMIEQLPDNKIGEVHEYLQVRANDETYLILVTALHSYGWKLLTYVTEEQITGPLKKFNTWFFVLFIVSFIVIFLFSFSVNRMIHKPLYKLIQSFRKTELDHLHMSAPPQRDNEFDYIYRSFDNMMKKLNVSVRQNYEQKMALQQSELKQLQSQINPHFLYNGFYNIYRFCKSGDQETAATLAQRLASYYHFITRSGSDEVALRMEYQNALDYCEIQRIRFSNRIELQYDKLPPHLHPIQIPRLILQPVIENAFEHAFEHSSKGGILHVRIVEENSRIVFRIEDDGAQLTDEQIRLLEERLKMTSGVAEKTGILNVNGRIRLKYGEESGVAVSRSPLGGLRVDVIILVQGGWKNV
ncbi:sensor histidine kinase [Cohnella sp.]|uniref:sensor histidine kinase n=1 Tax=Cohnella sp. TaxID=1883426 RepID=UPI003704705E